MWIKSKATGEYYYTDGKKRTLCHDWNYDGDTYGRDVYRIRRINGYVDLLDTYNMIGYEVVTNSEIEKYVRDGISKCFIYSEKYNCYFDPTADGKHFGDYGFSVGGMAIDGTVEDMEKAIDSEVQDCIYRWTAQMF